MAHARPLLSHTIACIMQGHGVGEDRNHASVHQHTEGISNINYLLVYDNCYGISCHSLECMKLLHYHTEGVLQCRCTKYPTHHLWWSLHDPTSRVPLCQLKSPSNVGHFTIYEVYDIYATQLVMQHELKPHVSLAHQLQNIYEIYFCSHAWNDRRRGSRHENRLDKLILYSTSL